ncbi:MAG: hypothetical protein IPN71_21505 [Fibrobacteres bacterium]|nr:hypothetical protein [Fibrobacterota bacterium]
MRTILMLPSQATAGYSAPHNKFLWNSEFDCTGVRRLLTSSLLCIGLQARAYDLPHPSVPGPDPDFPPFVTEHNGVYDFPWGAGSYTWPEQLFWEHKSEIDRMSAQMIQSSEGTESDGKVPVMSCVAWGYEYLAATGGNASLGIGDMSKAEGWAQWGAWLTPRKEKYFAQDANGVVYYTSAGYVSPMMPLDSVDWPEGIRNATFGDFAGLKLGRLANRIHSRGFLAADFVVGLYGGNDYHPRVLDDFERWAGLKLPGATVAERFSAIKPNHSARFNDFKSERFARFYTRAAETIRADGREPLVGGQILQQAALVRGSGNDFRIYLKHLPARNWYFNVELQSDEGRAVPAYWSASTGMGGHCARSPELPIGAHMDAWQQNFTNAVKNAGKDMEWARKYLKHAWLSVGWTHVANLDGSVRRAPQAFNRAYWDAGVVDTPVVALMRAHAPKHPFGPAFYYSTDLERQSESTRDPNFYYWFEPRVVGWRLSGIPSGYFVSDTALANLAPVNRPSGWFVYVDNLGFTHLKPEEKARLEAIAPILTESQVRDSCPLSFAGDSLGGFGFIDQHGSVIVVVSNSGESQVKGGLHFAKVENGAYQMTELLGSDSRILTIANHTGEVPLVVEGRDTRVFQIDGLRELGRKDLVPWYGPAVGRYIPPGVVRPDGKRLDILGRRWDAGPRLMWTAPLP